MASGQAALTPDNNGPELAGLDDIVGFHLRLAHGAVYRHFTETFTDLDLTQKQVSVLWLVADHPGVSQIELGTRLQPYEPTWDLQREVHAAVASGEVGVDELESVLNAVLLGGASDVLCAGCREADTFWPQ